MTTLVIKNKGLIEVGDLTLIGSSTKRDDDSKIGMYGSGNKYALAWFLRNNIDIRIFSGKEEINLSHELVKHRNREIAVLTVNGKQTSITSEMGPEWTGWMALREIVSNAIDEGDYEIVTAFNTEAFGQDGSTMIHIPLNNELNQVIRNYDYYFAFDRKPTYTNEYGSVYLKSEKSLTNLYRKGIKCYEEKEVKTWLDFNLNEVDISESRVCDHYEKNYRIKSFIHDSDDIPKHVLLKALLDDSVSNSFNENHLVQIKELIEDGYIFNSRKLQMLLGMFGNKTDKTVIIPHYWWEILNENGLVDSPFKFGDVEFIENTEYNTSEIKYYFIALGMEDVGIFAGKIDSGRDVVGNDKMQFFIKDSTKATPKSLAAKIIKLLPDDYIANKLL